MKPPMRRGLFYIKLFWDRYKKKQSRRYSGTVKKFVLNLTKKEQGSSGGTNFKLLSKDSLDCCGSGFCFSSN